MDGFILGDESTLWKVYIFLEIRKAGIYRLAHLTRVNNSFKMAHLVLNSLNKHHLLARHIISFTVCDRSPNIYFCILAL